MMEEVYTCSCGNQAWTIYGYRVECARCGNRFDLSGHQEPKIFNGRVRLKARGRSSESPQSVEDQ